MLVSIPVQILAMGHTMRSELWRKALSRNFPELLTAAIVFGALMYVYYRSDLRAYQTDQSSSPNAAEYTNRGTTGDYYGGMLNPWFTLASIILFYSSLRLQREDLKATREELQKTNEHHEANAESQRNIFEAQSRELDTNLVRGLISDFFGAVRSMHLKSGDTVMEGFDAVARLADVGALRSGHWGFTNISKIEIIAQISMFLAVVDFLVQSSNQQRTAPYIRDVYSVFLTHFPKRILREWLRFAQNVIDKKSIGLDEFDYGIVNTLVDGGFLDRYPASPERMGPWLQELEQARAPTSGLPGPL